jgi:hypothetical protein
MVFFAGPDSSLEPPLGGFLNDGKTVHVLKDAVVLAGETRLPRPAIIK